MSPATQKPAALTKQLPCILIVDDEADVVELINTVVGKQIKCRTLTAKNLGEARKILATEKVELMLCDLHLPDGDGMTLLGNLHAQHPTAGAMVITGQPTMHGAIRAIREGMFDFLPKPFNSDMLVERVTLALQRQEALVKADRRIERLKKAVKHLNESRRVVTQKVDLLCNDLVSAYGEISKQVEEVRTAEAFRKLLAEAKDLEQLLCHGMDFILRHCGYCNVAVWLASEDREFELGAYMKYTIPGVQELTESMKSGLLPATVKQGMLHFDGKNLKAQLTPAELQHLSGQTILTTNCAYLGETLAALVLFRDVKSPFSDEDASLLKTIAPIFATALASSVRSEDGGGDEGYGDDDDDTDGPETDPGFDGDATPRKKSNRKDRSEDWWKRGEAPPF